jgi:hypothetical protein
VGKLAAANSIAFKRGITNGEMEDALKENETVDKEMYGYLLEQNANEN